MWGLLHVAETLVELMDWREKRKDEHGRARARNERLQAAERDLWRTAVQAGEPELADTERSASGKRGSGIL